MRIERDGEAAGGEFFAVGRENGGGHGLLSGRRLFDEDIEVVEDRERIGGSSSFEQRERVGEAHVHIGGSSGESCRSFLQIDRLTGE